MLSRADRYNAISQRLGDAEPSPLHKRNPNGDIETRIFLKHARAEIPMRAIREHYHVTHYPLRPASTARPQPLNPGYRLSARARNVGCWSEIR
jgi:hypothetical protein